MRALVLLLLVLTTCAAWHGASRHCVTRRTAVPRLVATSFVGIAESCIPVECILGPLEADCAVVSLERHPALPLPRMCVVGKQGAPLTDAAIDDFLEFIGEALENGEPFSVLWQVSDCAFPSMAQVRDGCPS